MHLEKMFYFQVKFLCICFCFFLENLFFRRVFITDTLLSSTCLKKNISFVKTVIYLLFYGDIICQMAISF